MWKKTNYSDKNNTIISEHTAAFTVRRSGLGHKEVKALMLGVSKCNRRPAEGPYDTQIKSRIAGEKRSQKMLIDAREAVRKTFCGFAAQLFKERRDDG